MSARCTVPAPPAVPAMAASVGRLVEPVTIPIGPARLAGELVVPAGASGLVVFAHGSGSSRLSPRNRVVARTLQDAGLGTLLFDLLTRREEAAEAADGRYRFDISLLARRLAVAAAWVAEHPAAASLRLGYFGSSTGGAAALVAAADAGDSVGAVVSRGGRPDLAGEALERVVTPTLLIVGGEDHRVLDLNQAAYARLRGPKRLEVVPGATHLFEEPGALEQVASLAAGWFRRNLTAD